VNSAEIEIDGANAQILLKANSTTVDALGERVSAAEIDIDGLNSQITLKADKIDLRGYVTMQDYEAGIADLSAAFADSVSTEYLVASTYATFNCPINYQGDAVQKTKVPVVTEFTQASGQTAPTTDKTFLLTTSGSDTAQTVAAGNTKTF